MPPPLHHPKDMTDLLKTLHELLDIEEPVYYWNFYLMHYRLRKRRVEQYRNGEWCEMWRTVDGYDAEEAERSHDFMYRAVTEKRYDVNEAYGLDMDEHFCDLATEATTTQPIIPPPTPKPKPPTATYTLNW